MDIVYTDEFVKRVRKLSKQVQKRAIKQEKLFRTHPLHPSLHTEKLQPRSRELWSLRVDRKYRIVFRQYDDDSVVFITIGEHDWIYKYTDRL